MNEKEVASRSDQFMIERGYYYALPTEDTEVRIPLIKRQVFIDCIYKKKDYSDVVLLENTGNHNFEQTRSHFGRLAYALAVYGCKGVLAVQDKAKSYLPDLRKWADIVFLNPKIRDRMFFLLVGDDKNIRFKLLDLNGKRRGGGKEW